MIADYILIGIALEDDYKLFYAHLSDTVTYTCMQLDAVEANSYQYEISYFPPKEVFMHGLVDLTESDQKNDETEWNRRPAEEERNE